MYGPTVEISERNRVMNPLNPTANQIISVTVKVISVPDPSRFSRWPRRYLRCETRSNLTASGEMFDPMQLTAAHPTPPIPSYARESPTSPTVVRSSCVLTIAAPGGTGSVISPVRARRSSEYLGIILKVRIDPYYRSAIFALRPGDGLYDGGETDLRPAPAPRFKRRNGKRRAQATARRRSSGQ